MPLWRISTHRGRDAVSGVGARQFGGRWNRVGQPAVYASEQLSLAALEILAHLDTDTPVRVMWVIRIELPSDMPTTELTASALPTGWRDLDSPICRDEGSAWLEAGESPLLLVPSALIPEERNVVLNPEHPAFARGIPHTVTRRFSFDPRLLR
jgi:RES domain-containing protein